MKIALSPRGISSRGNAFTKFKMPAGAALAVLTCASLPTARAADIVWDAASPGLFTTPANWAGDVVPAAADNAIIDNGGTAQIGSSDNITITNLVIRDGSVTQNGGSMFATGPDEQPLAAYSIGWSAGLTGSYTATGGASLSGGRAIIGNTGGTGVFTLSGGSTYNGDGGKRTDIGNGEGSTGTLNVESGSTWTTNDWMIVGRDGTGTLNVSGVGTTVTANGQIYIGENTHGVGTATVSNGAQLIGTGELIVATGGATSTMTITDTATVNSAQFFVGNQVGSVGTLNMQGGSITSSSWVVVGRSAGNGTATMSGSSLWTKIGDGNFAIGDGFQGDGVGTMTIKDTAHLDIQNGQLWVGAEGSAAANGTLNVNGGTVDVNDWVSVGRNHTTGTLNITNGTFNVNAVGSFAGGPNFTSEGSAAGNAVINQSGGTFNNLASDTILGETNGSVAIWNATGGVANHNVLRVGGLGGSQGIINIGSSAVVNAIVTYVSSDGGSSGELNLNSGGILNAGHIEGGAGTRSVGFDGGQLNATGNDDFFITDFLANEVNLKVGGLNISTGTFTVGISTQLSGVGGINKTGSGTLVIKLPNSGPADANTYSGTTLVSAGTLQALNTNLGVGDVRVANGAHLVLNINTAVDDFADIYLDGTTSTLALDFGSGIFETIGSLTVNGVAVPIGTYTAAQLNGLYAGQFSGDGSLIVTTAVPEPSTVALAVVGLGSVFFLRRRRAVA